MTLTNEREEIRLREARITALQNQTEALEAQTEALEAHTRVMQELLGQLKRSEF